MYNTIPCNPFPISSDELSSLESGLTNYETQNDLNLEVPDRKNLLPIIKSNLQAIKSGNTIGVWNNNVYTVNGVLFTLNFSGNGELENVNISGRLDTIMAQLVIPLKIKNGNYILSGMNTIGEANKTYLQYNEGNYWSPADIGNEASIISNGDSASVLIVIRTVGDLNVNLYPMIRKASDTDPTFAPYIPSVDARLDSVESGLNDCALIVKECTIANNTDSQIFPYPTGITQSNALIVGVRILTKYDSIVDSSYVDYYGSVRFDLTDIVFTPNVAGNAIKIWFYFRKIV